MASKAAETSRLQSSHVLHDVDPATGQSGANHFPYSLHVQLTSAEPREARRLTHFERRRPPERRPDPEFIARLVAAQARDIADPAMSREVA